MEIKYSDVSYKIGDKTVLENINLTIKENKITALIGVSGSGKTTLLKMLNGLIIPSAGKVIVGDFTIEKGKKITNIRDLRKMVGFVFQFPEEQFFNQTVLDEIAFALNNFNYPKEKINKHVSDALYMVGLDESYLNSNPFYLSSGEKRRIALASILAYNPKILIFDEPTVGLDYQAKKNLMQIIRKLKSRYHKTIIIISHDVDFLHTFVDEVVVLNKGKLILSGNKYDVFNAVDTLNKYDIAIPKVILFKNIVYNKKNVKLPSRDNINDLIKDIYRNV